MEKCIYCNREISPYLGGKLFKNGKVAHWSCVVNDLIDSAEELLDELPDVTSFTIEEMVDSIKKAKGL